MSHDAIPTIGINDVPDPLPPDLEVLDVREDLEWQHGHIAAATHIPLGDLSGRLDEVPSGRLLVVCRVGGRSAQAVHYLRAGGHDAVNLRGGMIDWADARRPMVNELATPPRVV